jgi:hypothetical protein
VQDWPILEQHTPLQFIEQHWEPFWHIVPLPPHMLQVPFQQVKPEQQGFVASHCAPTFWHGMTHVEPLQLPEQQSVLAMQPAPATWHIWQAPPWQSVPLQQILAALHACPALAQSAHTPLTHSP